ncbi:MAG: hypothetical protein Q8922_02900 [Bacteroidota bacterium]|nr:hypothetical protein [Bacteroidota bacterium]MDP4232914.1 hypothetical protein [Bacteroidota bacterium]MDP4241958.1 hypothetical protein [Bacteroidota bacterium]MDP4286861.1 hypothetical protein [Bacteroidota bacterium]
MRKFAVMVLTFLLFSLSFLADVDWEKHVAFIAALALSIVKLIEWRQNYGFSIRLDVVNYYHKERDPRGENVHEDMLLLYIIVRGDKLISVDGVSLRDQRGREISATYDWERDWTFSKEERSYPIRFENIQLWKGETKKVRAEVTYNGHKRPRRSGYIGFARLRSVDETILMDRKVAPSGTDIDAPL